MICPACGTKASLYVNCPGCGHELPWYDWYSWKEFIPLVRYQKPKPPEMPTFLSNVTGAELEYLFGRHEFPGMSIVR